MRGAFHNEQKHILLSSSSAKTMSSPALLRLTILIGLLSVSTVARPCKTFFISYSFSFNPENLYPNGPSSQYLEIRGSVLDGRQFQYPSEIFISRRIFPSGDLSVPQIQRPEEHRSSQSLFPFTDDDISSLRDRTKDILRVVTALLFGVGCGALTGAIMYFFWALFAGKKRHNGYSVAFEKFGDGDISDSGDDASPKKMGYVKIPAADALDSVPAPNKEDLMEENNRSPNQPGGEPPADASDWRAQLQPDSRQRIVNKITETLKRHLPFSGPEGMVELKRIAGRFEEKIYTVATNQNDYLRRISIKMLTMERCQNAPPNSLQPGSLGDGNQQPPVPDDEREATGDPGV